MHTPFPLLAAIYSFFLLFAAIASAQGRGEFPQAGPGPGPPSRTTENDAQNSGNPGRVNVGHLAGNNRVIEVPADPEPSGTRRGPQFPNGNGGPFPGMKGGHRVNLKDVDSPDRGVFAKNKQQQNTAMIPPPTSLSNGTNGTAGLMKRWTNPYKLPTRSTKRSTGIIHGKFKPQKAKRRWFSF